MKILIVDAGEQNCKERFLRELTRGPYEFFLLVNSAQRVPANQWYLKYIPATHIFSADFRNVQAMTRSLREQLTSRGIRLSGVTTYYEEAVLVTQAIANELSLTPITTGDPLVLRNKSLMRLRFSAAGLPQPHSVLCRTVSEARSAIDEIGTPCVVKPNQMTASVGVRKVSSRKEEEIKNALCLAFTEDIAEEDTRFAYNISPEVVVEEYVPTSQEVSCEGLVQRGRVQLLSITRKFLSPEPLFEEIGHATPYPVSTETKAVLEDQLIRASEALKLHSTAFHAEFRLSQKEQPVLIEIGARLPGGFIPQLVRLSQGVDMLQASLQLAIGQETNLFSQNGAAAAISFLLDTDSVRKFEATEDRIRALPFVDELVIYGNAGTGRLGHIIWTARDFGGLENGWSTISEAC